MYVGVYPNIISRRHFQRVGRSRGSELGLGLAVRVRVRVRVRVEG